MHPGQRPCSWDRDAQDMGCHNAARLHERYRPPSTDVPLTALTHRRDHDMERLPVWQN
jgi:hypothetical protein